MPKLSWINVIAGAVSFGIMVLAFSHGRTEIALFNGAAALVNLFVVLLLLALK